MKNRHYHFANAMKKPLISAAFLLSTAAAGAVIARADSDMYRMYNPNSGEHFYTASYDEASHLQSVGWNYEGIGWTAPDKGRDVFRLYNPNAGDHHYTTDTNERDYLIRAGWQNEGIGWRSGGTIAVYRSYNPNAKAGAHNYTASQFEAQSLSQAGWNDEGIGWYGTKPNAKQGESVNVNSGAVLDKLNRKRETTRKDVLTSGDGSARAALIRDSDLSSWAQTRANEIAGQSTGHGVALSHDNTKNGMPFWANGSLFRSPGYRNGTIAWGPEALYYEFGVDGETAINNALEFWWDELNNGYSNYSHYLILSSPLANRIGFGVSRAPNGAIIVAAEIAYR